MQKPARSKGAQIDKQTHLLRACFCNRIFANQFLIGIVRNLNSIHFPIFQNMKKQFLTITALIGLMMFAVCVLAQNAPPKEQNKREADLLELVKLDKTIKLDIRYARNDNFVGRAVYTEARAFLQRPAAEALVRVHKLLKQQGLGLVIFDGYRPWSVTKIFWDSASEVERKIEFVANPQKGSRHNRGCAADISLFDLATGREVAMPSGYDEFSERAFPTYAGGPAEARALRDLLRATMEAEGFTVYPAEWWHFDYQDWKYYGLQDIPFDTIR